MKQNIIIFLSLVFLGIPPILADENTCDSSKGPVSTQVELDAATEMLRTKEHHWKFKPFEGAVCIGRNAEQSDASETNSQKSNQCSGDLVYTTNQRGFHNYTPVKLSWGAQLTENDVFKVHFYEKTIGVSYDTEKSKCTTTRYGTKLDSYRGVFKTQTQFEIPEDVWILSIRTVKKTDYNDFKFKTLGFLLRFKKEDRDFSIGKLHFSVLFV